MDGGTVKDILSLRHIFTTLREILFDPTSLASRVREGGFSGLTRPIPFVTACFVILSIAFKYQGKASPLSKLETVDQIEIFLLLFLPFAALYHFWTKALVGSSDTSLSAGISGWLYVGGILSLVTAFLVLIDTAVTGVPFLPVAVVVLTLCTVLLLTCTVMRHLYGASDLSDVRKSIYPSAILSYLLFNSRSWFYEKMGFNPPAWLATQLDNLLH
jgi:hypothetical protein